MQSDEGFDEGIEAQRQHDLDLARKCKILRAVCTRISSSVITRVCAAKSKGIFSRKYIYTIETAVTNGNGSSSAVPQALATDDEIEVTAVIFKRGTSDFVWIADRLSRHFPGAKIPPLPTYRENIQTVIAQMTEWLAAIPRVVPHIHALCRDWLYFVSSAPYELELQMRSPEPTMHSHYETHKMKQKRDSKKVHGSRQEEEYDAHQDATTGIGYLGGSESARKICVATSSCTLALSSS